MLDKNDQTELQNNSPEEDNATEVVEKADSEGNEAPKKKKKSSTKYVLSILFMIALIVVTLVILFTKYDFNELMDILKNVDLKWVFLGILMIFIYVFFEGLAMEILFRAMGVRVGIWKNFVYSAADYYFCAITPSATGGQPMVAYYMSKDKISLSHVSIVLLINTALFKIVLVTLAIIGAIIFPQAIVGTNHTVLMVVLFSFGAVFNIFMIVMCFLGAFKKKWVQPLGNRFIMWCKKRHFTKRPMYWFRLFRTKMNEYGEGGKLILTHKGHFTLALLCNFIQRIALFAATYFVFMAFYEADVYGLTYQSFFVCTAVQIIIALSVDSLPLPGGVGISELLNILLLGLVYQSSLINAEDMVASSMLLTRAVSFYIPVIVTGLVVIVKHISILRRDRKNDRSI